MIVTQILIEKLGPDFAYVFGSGNLFFIEAESEFCFVDNDFVGQANGEIGFGVEHGLEGAVNFILVFV